MKVLLTGITGNLGFEIAQSLIMRGVEIVPVVRNATTFRVLNLAIDNVIEADLVVGNVQINQTGIDCIIHCAGNVQFEKSGEQNVRMMKSVIDMAKDLDVPIYYISTAFLWSGSTNQEKTRNAYEKDKSYSEKLLQDSNLRHTIFRPSVLVGNSVTGKLINWTGYYLLVSKFWQVAKTADENRIKFPILVGTSNMMPINQVAEEIVQTVVSFKLNELIYVTNPEPPDAQWVLETTLDFLGIRDKFEFQAISFSDFEKIPRTNEEEILYQTGKHFSSYWALPYNFPTSICRNNLITKEYLEKTLGVFQVVNKMGIV